MLPLYLSIEGLYSYQDKQEIDFSILTEAGLFGIFGNVGSGKSSILEAISYALYGETERLGIKEKRSYNMLNLKSDQALIDFQFLNFENRKFRFIVQWKRRKKFEDTTSIERTAYEWKDEAWFPLESTDGARVTNLSYANFRRTIIIPQGQFKEFLELKGKERSEMMKEIFFLNQYDLGPKVNFLQAENNRKIENLTGALSGFEEVSEEAKETKTQEVEAAKINLSTLKVDFDTLTTQHRNLTIAKENRHNLYLKEQEWNELNEKHSKIQQYEKEVIEYESVSIHFKEHINNLHQITSTKGQLLSKIEQLQDNKNLLGTTITTTQNQLLTLKPDYDNLDRFKKQILEYDLLLQNVDLAIKRNEIVLRIENGTPILKETKAKEINLSNDLLKAEEQLEQLKNKQVNTTDLLAIEAWYLTMDEITRQEENTKTQLTNLQGEILALQEKFNSHHVDLNTWQNSLQAKKEQLDEYQKSLQEKEASLRLKQELSKYILSLHDGEACPLCGSTDHPDIMHTDDLSLELHELKNDKEDWAKEELSLRMLQTELSTTAEYLKDKRIQEQKIEQEIEQIKLTESSHLVKFNWPDFNVSDRSLFENQKTKVKELEELTKDKDLEIKSLRNNIQNIKENIIKFEQKLNDLNNQILIIDSNITQNLNQVKELNSIDPSNLTKMELTIQSNQLNEKIKQVEYQFKEWTTQLQEIQSRYATISGQLTEAQEQYKSYNSQLHTVQATIKSLLHEFNYNDITEVKAILAKSIDTKSLKETIQQFYLTVNSVSERIKELKELTKDDNYAQELYEELTIQTEAKRIELEEQISKTGALESELQQLTIELDKKSNLLLEFHKLTARKDNLTLLNNMFKGNGFINYVSSIHLERLCEIANKRFHRLTKNQLSLCINESNEFEVKDFLNNGYQRSVKTLSGGQTFQASLCLALALAENIQALNKADRNFFFIDEGFGTQDNESINTVFDTLQYLNQENRVVGIISHVDELKEKMPRSITVLKDIEKGSQIKYN